ncbi:MAG: TonB family protein [Luteibaculaceae bacterium]
MENKTEEKDRRKSIIIAIVIHALFILLFAFFGLKQPNPIPRDEGIAIALDFGFSQTGSGSNNQSTEVSPVEAPQPQPVTQVQPQPQVTQSVSTPTQESAPVEVPTAKEPTPEPVEEPKKVNDRLKSALNNAFSNTGGGSQGEGDDNTAGNKGKPTGGEGKGALGGGAGSWELAGRSLVKGTTIPDTKEEGKVVVNILVDRAGNVVRANVNLQESNTTSSYLHGIAVKAAREFKYNAQPNAQAEQSGKITFTFILQ